MSIFEYIDSLTSISDAANKSELYAAELGCKIIRAKLTAAIKIHLNHIESSYINKQCYYKNAEKECLGGLKFINPSIFLKSLDPSHSDVGRMITPTDKLLAYQFFMFREVIGKMARTLEPDWVLTFEEGSSKSYTKHNILDTFKYFDSNNNAIFGHEGAKVNQDAVAILKADKKQVQNIIKNVFEEYANDCNKLKVITNLNHQVTVCQNLNEVTDPDYFLNLLTCLEIFNLATTGGFCKEDNEAADLAFKTDKTQDQINKYVTSLITTAVGPHVRVSEMDLGNQMQVIKDKLDVSIKYHLTYVESSYVNKQCYYKNAEKECLGDLKFINPGVFLKSLDPSHSDVGRIITPTNKLLAYEFFMFREVIGASARKLEPDWVLTFKKGISESYTRHDVLDTFKYVDSNQNDIKGHNGNRVNKAAWNILKEDIKEVEKIIKGVFEEYGNDCNTLKATTDMSHQVTVCQNLNEVTDPDYFFNLLTCLEIFNLATTGGFCKEDNSDL